jgi:hypothetical protein
MSEHIRRVLFTLVRPAAAFIVLTIIFGATLRADSQKLLFAQRDEVKAFDVTTGAGYQVGTTSGLVEGTSYVNFKLVITGGPGPDGGLPVSFNNKVIITDIDGDQLFFDNNGTGVFHVGIPGDTFAGVGGPQTGTYTLTGGTGKFATWTVGATYEYRAVMTNPPNGALGNVFAEVTYQGKKP